MWHVSGSEPAGELQAPAAIYHEIHASFLRGVLNEYTYPHDQNATREENIATSYSDRCMPVCDWGR
jgi:hypothetical protein